MKNFSYAIFFITAGIIFSHSQALAQDSNPLVDEILRDVIEYTEKKADEVVREKTVTCPRNFPKGNCQRPQGSNVDLTPLLCGIAVKITQPDTLASSLLSI